MKTEPFSNPILEWVASKLYKLVGRQGVPFDRIDIQNAKWIYSSFADELLNLRGGM
jgi:hypothetical protein